MPKYRIYWQIGSYGESEEIIEADSLEEANKMAHEAAHDEADSMITAGAEEIKE